MATLLRQPLNHLSRCIVGYHCCKSIRVLLSLWSSDMADDKQVNSAKPEEKNDASKMQSSRQSKEDSQLDSVTDIVKEGEMDKKKCMKALEELAKMEKNQAQEEKKRRKELKAVQVKEEDVVYLEKEMLLSRKEADTYLRLSNGNLSDTLKKLIEPQQQKRMNARPNMLY